MNTVISPAVIDAVTNITGPQYLLTDPASCALYAQDVYTKAIPAGAVVQPGNLDELSQVIKTLVDNDIVVIPRGGGMSYTSGYVPVSEGAVIIDISRMNKVVEINEEDMYVTVEAGCTWQTLHEALESKKLRTPCWGTLSGIHATVGGGASQNGMFWGSGQFGAIGDSIISMQVIVADGSVVATGSDAQKNGSPFFRHFGPDLTGLFIGDNGALGMKGTVTLRLMRQLPAKDYISMDFSKGADALNAMSEISRRGLAMECFGFDPFLQAQRKKRESLLTDAKALAGFMKSAGSLKKALVGGAKIALAGRGYMDDVDFSIQVIIEESGEQSAEASAKAVRDIIKKYNGREIESTIPKVVRANPFGPLNNMVGPAGERWVPTHGLFPHSKIVSAWEATEAVFAKHRETLDKYEIGCGYLFATIASNAFVLEPVFFWPDELKELHEQTVTPSHFAKLTKFPENLEIRAYVDKVKKELVDLYSEMGSSHFQLGKAYHYTTGLKPESLGLITAIKSYLDPKNLLNPGALGFTPDNR
ncbi:FAD-binding oxidoreductase [Alteromonas sp. 1_MG-2023]|uniref:FAD-binding oxidoreductase n=1 Tax=Alteromonas sp. 1_MG-2023 TaxID=3062669 RepID=UPI0026E288E7|nr:FAD-binding oxidoreductase [Alteromonas sp. 1_MG-2023]MDO6475151.1 FAD-binding oxidoreductase [Alteromonas sp. 1_MG-2023]